MAVLKKEDDRWTTPHYVVAMYAISMKLYTQFIKNSFSDNFLSKLFNRLKIYKTSYIESSSVKNMVIETQTQISKEQILMSSTKEQTYTIVYQVILPDSTDIRHFIN
jgi:hypothetical protein